jgi:site-specific recombinase XerD
MLEPVGVKSIRAGIKVFIADKQVGNLSSDPIKKYKLHPGRLATFTEASGVFTLAGINRKLITRFCEGWAAMYPSSLTRHKLRERYKSFFKFCQEAKWVSEVPLRPKMKAGIVPLLPLNMDEYNRLLDSVLVVVKAPKDAVVENQTYGYWRVRVHGHFQLTRHSGLSIQDALTLRRSEPIHDASGQRWVPIYPC